MAITQSQAISNLMITLDDFFASLRMNIDNKNVDSVIQLLNVLRCQNYGESIDIFTRGVIFGLKTCQIKKLADTWGVDYGSSNPENSLLYGEDMNDWVITRGNIYNGTKIINIDPPEGKLYVYKIQPYITDQMENYLIPGAVFYSTSANIFSTYLSGQVNSNYPVIAIEKTGINKDKFVEKIDYKYFNNSFNITPGLNDIIICRFILDVIDINNYEINVLDFKNLYPYIYGQPYYSFMEFSAKIYNYIKKAIIDGYDNEVVYDMLYYIVNADVWGTGPNAFYNYWLTRNLPSNVKYYYNNLFTPTL